MLSDEQMSNGLPFSLLNDEQMSNWVGVKRLPVFLHHPPIGFCPGSRVVIPQTESLGFPRSPPPFPLWVHRASSEASDFVTRNGAYVNLPLGSGVFYNHSSEPNVYPLVYQSSPFLQAFVCQEDVEMGDELLLNYGPAYWKAPWRGVPKSDACLARQDVVEKKRRQAKPKEKKWFEKCFAKVEGIVLLNLGGHMNFVMFCDLERLELEKRNHISMSTCNQDQSRQSFLVCKTRFFFVPETSVT